jgi:GNAT superfamily N-acetyltransferase
MNMDFFEIENDNCIVSTNKNLLDINIIHQYLSAESYWALCIPIATVQKAIDNSICFGVYKNNIQVGFARVITDTATFAYLSDVFIVKNEQGKGLGKLLMQTIHQHPNLQGLRRLLLTTKDAHSLYEQFGWQKINDDSKAD